MKTKLLTLLAVAALLASCNHQGQKENGEYSRSSLSIITPTGAPALAFYNYAGLSNFETNSVPANIVSLMAAGQKDVVVLPTNAGMQAITKANGVPYKIAATITFGNFYIVSTGHDDDGVMDATDTILLFQKNNVPDKIFHYIYGDELDDNLYYVNAVSDAATACLTAGETFINPDTGDNTPADYVLLAEPVLTNVLSKKSNITVYANIQEKYKEKSGDKELFQASVFISNKVNEDIAKGFLSSLKVDIEAAIADPSKLSTGMNKAGDTAQELYGVAPQMAENVLKKNNGMGLCFKYAKENKEAIETFLKLFSINEVSEEVYF